jgi:hypothetical protein
MATMDLDKLKSAYKAGAQIRERITNYSAKDMNVAIKNIVNLTRLTCASKMKDFENISENGFLVLKYGEEKNREQNLPSFDFILKEATLSYDHYDTYGNHNIYEVKIDCFGIFVTCKKENKQNEEILSLYWDGYEKLKEQFLEIFP